MKTNEDIKGWMQEALIDELGIQSLNCIYDKAMKYVIEVALQQMPAPPCAFSWFVLGSAGRSEMMATSDQDHGIVFQESGHEHYFLMLGKAISEGLHTLGFDYCIGHVMSSERAWCRSLAEWQQQLAIWKTSEELKDVRHMQMMLDFRVVYGSEQLKDDMLTFIYPIDADLLERLAQNISLIKKGLTPLGQLIVDQQQCFDFKNCIYVPYINAIRMQKLRGEKVDSTLYFEVMQLRLIGEAEMKVTAKNRAALKNITKAVRKLHSEILSQIGIRC